MKRYEMQIIDLVSGDSDIVKIECSDGPWIKFEDIEPLVTAIENLITTMLIDCEQFWALKKAYKDLEIDDGYDENHIFVKPKG